MNPNEFRKYAIKHHGISSLTLDSYTSSVIKNPGRYAAYKHLTGHDISVQDFLRQETKMQDFLDHVFALVSINVEDYMMRGFEHLSVSFGCTGGQHRSVYAAEQLAAYISNRYNIPVTVMHLNEKKWMLDPQTGNTEQ